MQPLQPKNNFFSQFRSTLDDCLFCCNLNFRIYYIVKVGTFKCLMRIFFVSGVFQNFEVDFWLLLKAKKFFFKILFSIIHMKHINFEQAGLLKIVLIVTPLKKVLIRANFLMGCELVMDNLYDQAFCDCDTCQVDNDNVPQDDNWVQTYPYRIQDCL